MPFTSTTFLFVFLPAVLAAYWIARNQSMRNLLLLAASLLFYAWGEGPFIGILLGSILANYVFGLWIGRARGKTAAAFPLTVAIVVNVAPLAILKYGGFVVTNVNAALHLTGASALQVPAWRLPAGISFFTFMALSYVIGVHRREVEAQRNPLLLGLYIALFPLIMAGPICRYRDLAPQLPDHPMSRGAFAEGARRFVFGLSKKMLIANTLAVPANAIFALSPKELSAPLAWLGLACYTLQIFFDFAGYSDMAIGLGRMLGFRFMENFDYPYASTSLRVFWTRWHISLSTWFRDYVFLLTAFPAGRVLEKWASGRRRIEFWAYTIATLLTMSLIGAWHGASWGFIVWGLYHSAFLVLERTRVGKRLGRFPRPLQHLYLLGVVMAGWVLFRAGTVGQAVGFFAALAGHGGGARAPLAMFMTPDVVLALAAGATLSTRIVPALRIWVEGRLDALPARPGMALTACVSTLEVVLVSALLVLSISWLAAGTITPFIYFRF